MSADQPSVTATRTAHGVRVVGVRRYLGYTDVMTFPDDDARTLVVWLRRDGDTEGAQAVETALES